MKTAILTLVTGAFASLAFIALNAIDCAGREAAANLTGDACDFITGRSNSFVPDVRIDRAVATRAYAKAKACRAQGFGFRF